MPSRTARANQPRPVLIIARGLPGAGKTEEALRWVAEDPDQRVRVSAAELGAMMTGRPPVAGTTVPPHVLAARDAAITALLQAGLHVFCDDTNLPTRTVTALKRVARQAGGTWIDVDFTHVPLDECLARNATRTAPSRVPDVMIRSLYDKHIRPAGQTEPR